MKLHILKSYSYISCMDLINNQRVRQYSKLELKAREVVEGFITGMHKSPFHGFSVEFAENRLYNNGESTRHIDWKLYARTEKLFVKRYEEETNLRCQIVLDSSSSMYYPAQGENKMQFSIQAAAALSHLLKSQRDAIGLSTFSDGLVQHLPAKLNPQHIQLLYHTLEELQKLPSQNSLTQLSKALHSVAERIPKRSLVMVFSDLFESDESMDTLFDALQHLRYNKHEVVLFHVVKRNDEILFNFDNRPYRFVDLENGEEIKLNPSELKEQYESTLRKYEKELKIRCGQSRIDFVEADIDKGFDAVLMGYLAKRNKMK